MRKKLLTTCSCATVVATIFKGGLTANANVDETKGVIRRLSFQTIEENEKVEIKVKNEINVEVSKDEIEIKIDKPAYSYNDYQSCNILDVAEKGDILISEYATLDGVSGHALIVEKVEDNKVIVIEAIRQGVVRSEMDCYRFYDRRTTLFSVKGATNSDRDSAVAWVQERIGWKYNLLSQGCHDTEFQCAMLVHCAYNVAANKPLVNSFLVTPEIIRKSDMTVRKEVYFHGYTFINKKSAMCMDVPAFSTTVTQLKQWTCNGAVNQQFLMITANEEGAKNFIPAYNYDYTVEIDNPFSITNPFGDNSKNNGNKVLMNYRYSSYKIQRFMVYNEDNGLVSFRGQNTDYQKCITVKDGSQAQGAYLIQWQFRNDNSDKWTVVYSGVSHAYTFY